MAFKMKGNPLKMGSMATKSGMKMAKESAMKMKKESPAKKYASDAQRKAVHASKAESGMKMKKESPMKLSEEDKKKAMDNAMPAAKKVSMSKETMAGAKKYGFMDGGSFNQDKAKSELRRLSKMTSPTELNRAKQAEIRKLMKAFS